MIILKMRFLLFNENEIAVIPKDKTKNAIFIIQGNLNTSVEMRMEALKRIQDDLAECMPDMEFEIRVIDVATEN